MEKNNINGYINAVAGVAISAGLFCTLESDGTVILATASPSAGVFVAQASADAGDVVALKVVGASAGTVSATADAGEYAPGALVYYSADGKVATSGSVVAGVCVETEALTASDGDKVEVAPIYAVA